MDGSFRWVPSLGERLAAEQERPYTVYFPNFEYTHHARFATLPAAMRKVKEMGFDARIDRHGVPIYAWSVIGGFRPL